MCIYMYNIYFDNISANAHLNAICELSRFIISKNNSICNKQEINFVTALTA